MGFICATRTSVALLTQSPFAQRLSDFLISTVRLSSYGAPHSRPVLFNEPWQRSFFRRGLPVQV